MRKLITLVVLLAALPVQGAMMSATRWDLEAYNWLKNNQTNGNALSTKAYLVGTTFMQNLKQFGAVNGGLLRPRIGRANIYVGNDTNALQVPIIVDWSHGSYTNDDLVAFTASDYSETNGLTGDTTTKFIRCSASLGLNISSFGSGKSLHYASYVRTASTEGSSVTGVSTALGTWALTVRHTGNTYVFMGANTDNTADANGTGFYMSSRVETNLAYTYRGTTELLRDTDADSSSAGPLPEVALMVHAINIDGTIFKNSRTLSYYAVGHGITTNQVPPYKYTVELVQEEFGRKLP